MKLSILIRKCRNRNTKAQRLMVDHYSTYLYSVCCRYVQDRSFAKDCLQESWIQIFWNLDKYKEEGKWNAWITRVTINKCKEMLRKNNKWNMEVLEEDLIALESNTEDIIIEEETVNSFLERLPMRYRLIVNLYLVEEYSHKEIASFLEITESSSRSLLSRALKMLRESFKEPDELVSEEKDRLRLLRKTIYKKAII